MENKQPDHQRRVYTDITQLVAGPDNPTPLVRVNRTNPHEGFSLYLKLERCNPFGSIKDRVVVKMLEQLSVGERTLVEPTSGNTGIALACVANARGIPVEIVVPEGIPEEKKALLRFLGAELMEADDALCPLYPSEGARGVVNALVKSPATRDKYVSPNQYENELNVRAHYESTGPEIWRQTEGKIDYFFAGLGTCGTITGAGRYLKEQNPAIKIIAIEPASSTHRLPGLKRVSDLDEQYVPAILDTSIIDEIIPVSDEEAYRTAIRLARRDGIPVGPTTGAALAAALKYGATHRGTAVVISPDDAFKYSRLYEQWMESDAAAEAPRVYDLSGLMCPLSKVRATEIIDGLTPGEAVNIILGDADSLKNVAKELKTRGIKPAFTKDGEGTYTLSISLA